MVLAAGRRGGVGGHRAPRWHLSQNFGGWPPKEGEKRGAWHLSEGVSSGSHQGTEVGTEAPHLPFPEASMFEGKGGAPAGWGLRPLPSGS